MRTAKQLRAEIKKAEAKGKTCTFESTRTQWAEKVAFLRNELRLQLLWEAAGKPRPKALPRPRTPRPKAAPPLALPPPAAAPPPPEVLIPEVMAPLGTAPPPQAGSIKDFVVEILPSAIFLVLMGAWPVILGLIAFSVASYWQDTQRRTHP
jgi:hypothetical protein